ncbi:Transglutaminase-like superfamily protein [Botrimarina colliarenosi]|uniref:Transglutaminase-like superfamily protein n=1 Tax=Botrimarina colliarenosi TaxID=2528001 RepID=A0A5C6AJU5_9BACT|nr:7TM domain-containing protein [Botrimarina colliarenosi]TWT99518.1 Transglutaminase-like superfamily protein [Botrimarina colliarenosi]
MSSRSLSQLAIFGLLLIGGVGLAIRHSGRVADRTALEDSLWRLTYDVQFKATGDRTEVRLALPSDSDHVAIETENSTNPMLSERMVRLRPSGTRELVVSTSQQDNYRVTAEFVARLRPRGGWGEPPLQNLSGDTEAKYLSEERTIFPTRNADVLALLRRAESETTSDGGKLQWIFDHCSRDLKHAADNSNDSVLGALRDGSATPLGRARLMVTLCRAAKFPARLVTGFELRQQEQLQPHTWVEVFRDARWLPFDPVYGHARRLPNEFVAARRDGEEIVRTPKSAIAEEIVSKYSIVRLGPPDSVLDRTENHPSQVFDLTRLPVEMHEVLALLLLLPFGALITAFFRNIVGIPTLGTFAPALFAVSFVYADGTSGLLILAVVIIAGLAGRVLVGRLQLLMVPRLSIILTTIILCVVFSVSALDYLNLTPSANAVLLPLVIVTVLIERFYVTTEEDGVGFAMQLVAGTIGVGAVCYMVLSWETIGHIILVYPETHLITVALFIAIGRYAGYRLVELWRFRDLVKTD